MKRILVTGSAGQVGQDLQTSLAAYGEVIATDRHQLDLTQPDRLSEAILALKPDVIVNAAAYTAVDKAESEPELAALVNAIAPAQLAKAAQHLQIPLIHISTDYVFDGSNHVPYREDDRPNPLNVYGRTKLAGEEAVRQNCDRHLIVRTAWVYGVYGKGNFVKTMLRLGADRPEIRVVSDQIGSPTASRDLAQAIALLLPKLDQGESSGQGTFHLTNSGVASWYDFAVAIVEEAKAIGFPLTVQRVVPIPTAEYPTPAKRPAYSVLSLQKISTVLGDFPTHWRQSLRHMLIHLYQETYESVDSLRR